MNTRFNKETCTNSIKISITDILQRTIILSGTHAFEYSVSIVEPNKTTIITFKNRELATKEFKRYLKLKSNKELRKSH